MRGISRGISVLAMLGALMAVCCVCFGSAVASGAQAGAKAKPHKAQKPKAKFHILKPTQAAVSKGLTVKLNVKLPKQRHRRGHKPHRRKAVRIRVLGTSSTFDSPAFSKLTKPRVLKVRKSGNRTVKLSLTGAGRTEIASCQARTLRVQIGKRKTRAELRRTGACAGGAVDLSRAADCDFIGAQATSACLLPFPDDYYTKDSATSATGKLIDLHTPAMPDNAAGKPVAAAPYLRNDGFSPGETILVRVPGLDTPAALAATGAAPINHIGRYAEDAQPVVVIDAQTGQRQPIWTEIDSNTKSPDSTLVEIHPATNYASGHRYIVALRNLKAADGSAIPAPAGFRYYRDDLPANQSEINGRRDHFEQLFNTLKAAGIQRSNLYLAWDFTVASDLNIAGRALHMRDDAFKNVLGDPDLADGVVTGTTPSFQITGMTTPADPEIGRRLTGTFMVPCYLTNNCQPGGIFDLDSRGDPVRHGDYEANFDCIIPKDPMTGVALQNLRPATYGHGLFGSAGEVGNSPTNRTLAQNHGFIMCATDEIGMSNGDVGNTVANILPDMSRFPMLADRLQQGLLNELFLGRLMDNPSGFASARGFHVDQPADPLAANQKLSPTDPANPSVIDTSQFYYIGASQGGIMGGALTALSPDSTRTVLNVPAMNYSVLLPRSVDYDEFALFLNQQYSEIERPLILDLVQMLWDRGEPNGYAHRMTTDPLPNTPPHKVLMNVAFGDHQVTNFQADVEARTIGASTREPILYPGRFPDVDVLWNVPRIPAASLPFDGSAVIYGDIGPRRHADPNDLNSAMIGVPAPPLTNQPNRLGEDPHGAPRGAPAAILLISDFLKKTGGAVTNRCGTVACFAGGFSGP